jgi:hypothetical protein
MHCRSSSIGFLDVDFAPPRVKNGRLAFPEPSVIPSMLRLAILFDCPHDPATSNGAVHPFAE